MGRKPLVPDALIDGPFTTVEARQAGLQRWHLEGASWKRLMQGTYVRTQSDTTISMLRAASRRFPAEAAFSGATAAWLHGLDVQPCSPVEITVAPLMNVSRPVAMRVRRALLPGSDVVRLRGFRATAMARTIADLSAQLSVTEAVVVADAALHARRVTIEQLTAWADSNAGRRGIRRLRRVITLAEPAAESPMESRLRMVLVLGGLPRPRAQPTIRDVEGRFAGRPDLYYESARLGIEYDGGSHRDSIAGDDHRQNNLLGAGVRLLRFTYCDVIEDPASVVVQVETMLEVPWASLGENRSGL